MLHLVTGGARLHTARIEASELHPFSMMDLSSMENAVNRVHELSATPSCNDFFTKIGGGDSLQTLLNRDIYVYYNPSVEFAGFGSEDVIIITRRALDYAGEVLVAVLVHEMAHIGGVEGGYMPLSRRSHGLADHAMMQCVGVVTPHTSILNELSAYPL